MNSNPIFIDAINREQNKEKFIKFLAEVKYYYDLHGNEFHNFYHGINGNYFNNFSDAYVLYIFRM